ncbi:MAG TPA: phage holin family protein [Clostridia bacterium]|nr:phage holin family protein [Clostridia bacterium]
MRGFIVGTVATAVAFYVVTKVLPDMFGLDYLRYESDDLVGLLGLALVFGVVNGLIGPVVRAVSMPISFFTMGLAGFILNGVLLLVTAAVAEMVEIPFFVGDYPPDLNADTIVAAIVGAVILGVVNSLVHTFVPD